MVLVSDKPINMIVLTSLIVLIMHFLHAGRQHDTLPGTEEPMITSEFITALFYEVDEQLGTIPTPPKAHLWPSEVVTVGLLHALKGGGNRAFYPLADPRLSRVVSPPPRADAALSSFEEPSGVGAGLLGFSDRARGH
jgi:hypothetical protein